MSTGLLTCFPGSAALESEDDSHKTAFLVSSSAVQELGWKSKLSGRVCGPNRKAPATLFRLKATDGPVSAMVEYTGF